jgi:two-component system chemotaxis response regulator CheB
MKALPSPVPSAPDEAISGLSCPECFGVLNVMAEGSRDTLRFRCRIGHAYSAEEVLAGKERNLEDHLWAAITRIDELATFLGELVVAGRAGDRAAEYEERARECLRQKDVLTNLIQARAVADMPACEPLAESD